MVNLLRTHSKSTYWKVNEKLKEKSDNIGNQLELTMVINDLTSHKENEKQVAAEKFLAKWT